MPEMSGGKIKAYNTLIKKRTIERNTNETIHSDN